MKLLRCVMIALGLSGCWGMSGWGAESEGSREADHDALRQLRAKVVTAINQQDVKSLSECFTREFVLTMSDQTVITNATQLEEYYNRMFKDPQGPLSKIETTAEADVLTRFTGENTGYTFGSALDTYTLKDKRVIRIKNRWTALVQKEDGAWKASAVHIGINFLDNPVLRIRTMSIWRKIGIKLHWSSLPSD